VVLDSSQWSLVIHHSSVAFRFSPLATAFSFPLRTSCPRRRLSGDNSCLFFPGLSLEGGVLAQANSAKEKFYSIEDVGVKVIFKTEVTVPDEAKELIKLLEEYCKETD